jgi:hypothetical protein
MNNNVGIISYLEMAGTRMVEVLKCTFVFPNSRVPLRRVS